MEPPVAFRGSLGLWVRGSGRAVRDPAPPGIQSATPLPYVGLCVCSGGLQLACSMHAWPSSRTQALVLLARPPFGLPRSINIYMPQTNGTCVCKTKSRSTGQDHRSYYTIVPTPSVSPTHGRPRTGSHTHIHHS